MVKRDKWRLVFILAVILIAAFIVFPIQGKVRLGLDLMGGVHIVLQAKGTPENPVTLLGTKEKVRWIDATR